MTSLAPSATDSSAVVASNGLLIGVLLALFAIALILGFALTYYNITAPRVLLRQVLKAKLVLNEEQQSDLLRRAALVSERVTRASLAYIGFALLGIVLIASFALTGGGVQDLRSTIVGSVTTLIASIAGFYFASRSESLTATTASNKDKSGSAGKGKDGPATGGKNSPDGGSEPEPPQIVPGEADEVSLTHFESSS